MEVARTNRPLTKNVYLDTSVHVGAKFGYTTGNLRRLRELAAGGLVALFDTRVDEGEIEANIKTIAEHAANALKKFQREGSALRDLDRAEVQALFLDLKAGEVATHLRRAYLNFRRTAGVQRVQLPSNTADRVLDLYFREDAPFATGDKKSEFPDAMIVTALSDWCRQADDSMYVVTHDKGMSEAAQRTGDLLPLSSLDEFLSLIVSEEHETVAILVNRWLASQRESLAEEVSEAVLNGGFYLEDADGDVENIEIEELKLSEPLLVEVTDDEAVFTTRLQVSFEADISYADPSTGIYDSEDKVMVFMDRVHVRVRREDEFQAEVTVGFEPVEASAAAPSLEDAEIQAVRIRDGKDIPVSYEDPVVHVYPDADDDEDRQWYAELAAEDDVAIPEPSDEGGSADGELDDDDAPF